MFIIESTYIQHKFIPTYLLHVQFLFVFQASFPAEGMGMQLHIEYGIDP